VKLAFDEKWGGSWHCVIGKAFGSFVTHETQLFMYFYVGDKAVLLYKAG
jgi:dynein light chain LC8-type